MEEEKNEDKDEEIRTIRSKRRRRTNSSRRRLSRKTRRRRRKKRNKICHMLIYFDFFDIFVCKIIFRMRLIFPYLRDRTLFKLL